VLTALVAVVSLSVTGYACVLAIQKQHARAANSGRVVSGISAAVGSHAFAAALSGTAKPAPATSPSAAATLPASGPVALTALDRRDCPAAATACVNLAEKITWLQANGTVSYGPVRMEPGMPGTVHATPTGTFNVAWKAGPNYMSTIYHELIPWAVFFAPGGIAFHEGSLTSSSHGCVHLTMADAYYYNQHLFTGDEVVVFSGTS
jgi:lipoprotein-anchoring transpeptidase ErfK/SrfK